MIKISEQLRKYFIIISILSIAFITITTNMSINYFFSDYIRNSRSKDDLKVVQYVENVYSDYKVLDSQSLMNIMHYAFSEDVVIQLRDKEHNIIWNSSSFGLQYGMTDDFTQNQNNFKLSNYPLIQNESEIGSVDIGRTRSIISNIEDQKFLITINGIFVAASVLTLIIALRSSNSLARNFLNPILIIKENAKLIEQGNYRNLKKVDTNTAEIHELSLSVTQLAERLNDQESLRKRLTTDIAHDLRTPLAAIQSHIEAFIDGVWKPDEEKLSVIHEEVMRLTLLINELSELSVIEEKDRELHVSPLNLSEILSDVTENFEPMILDKKIVLYKNITPDLFISADPDYLKRIFVNILSNAVKYTNDYGRITVALSEVRDEVHVLVKDTGIGIPKEDLKYVFERFYRSDLSRNRKTGGNGIGLSITKALIETLKGTISIDSEIGKGTSVLITFHSIPFHSIPTSDRTV